MITIQIDEEQMKEMLSKTFEGNIKKILNDSSLEYWVRSEVQKLLAKEIVEKTINPMLTDRKIEEMLKQAIDNYVNQRFKSF